MLTVRASQGKKKKKKRTETEDEKFGVGKRRVGSSALNRMNIYK